MHGYLRPLVVASVLVVFAGGLRAQQNSQYSTAPQSTGAGGQTRWVSGNADTQRVRIVSMHYRSVMPTRSGSVIPNSASFGNA